MTIRISEVIHEWMGWCPDAHERVQNAEVRLDDEAVVPSKSGSFKDRAIHWLGLFRNQIILLALYFSVVGVLLSVFIGGIDVSMFFIGIVAGSLLSVFHAIRFWKTMNEVRQNGAVFLVTLYDKTTIAITLLMAMVPMFVFMGAIPGTDMTMLNSITGGLIFILFWWLLLIIWLWESQTKCHLQSDGLMLSLVKES
ncbi:MAG: DUF1673 family protein [Methanoregula sp.]|nr:MAG: DUF1673 family protein [Methanoregula sp.]